MFRFKRRSGPPRRAYVGAGTLVALVLLQSLTGMLGDLAVALLPDDWVQRRAIFIVIVLAISLTLVIALQWSSGAMPTQRARPVADRASAEAGATIPPTAWTAPSTTPPSSVRYEPRWGEALRTTREGIAEVLAILGLGVRLLVWLMGRSSSTGRNLGTQMGTEREHPPPVPAKPKPKPNWDEHGKNVAVGLLTAFVLLLVMTSSDVPSSATGTPLSPAVGLSKQLDADPLARPSRAWRQDSRSGLQQRGFARYFADRTYRIAIKRADMTVTSVSADPVLRSLGDGKVQVSVRASGTVAQGRFGALCRHRSDRYYLATLTDDGNYQVAKVTRAGKRIISEGRVEVMRQANVSVIEFACTGGHSGTPVGLDLVVNGTLVVSVVDTLQPLLTLGGVGLYAETGASSSDPFSGSSDQPNLEVAFEDFYVWTR
jgi:hypothetical protein